MASMKQAGGRIDLRGGAATTAGTSAFNFGASTRGGFGRPATKQQTDQPAHQQQQQQQQQQQSSAIPVASYKAYPKSPLGKLAATQLQQQHDQQRQHLSSSPPSQPTAPVSAASSTTSQLFGSSGFSQFGAPARDGFSGITGIGGGGSSGALDTSNLRFDFHAKQPSEVQQWLNSGPGGLLPAGPSSPPRGFNLNVQHGHISPSSGLADMHLSPGLHTPHHQMAGLDTPANAPGTRYMTPMATMAGTRGKVGSVLSRTGITQSAIPFPQFAQSSVAAAGMDGQSYSNQPVHSSILQSVLHGSDGVSRGINSDLPLFGGERRDIAPGTVTAQSELSDQQSQQPKYLARQLVSGAGARGSIGGSDSSTVGALQARKQSRSGGSLGSFADGGRGSIDEERRPTGIMRRRSGTRDVLVGSPSIYRDDHSIVGESFAGGSSYGSNAGLDEEDLYESEYSLHMPSINPASPGSARKSHSRRKSDDFAMPPLASYDETGGIMQFETDIDFLGAMSPSLEPPGTVVRGPSVQAPSAGMSSVKRLNGASTQFDVQAPGSVLRQTPHNETFLSSLLADGTASRRGQLGTISEATVEASTPLAPRSVLPTGPLAASVARNGPKSTAVSEATSPARPLGSGLNMKTFGAHPGSNPMGAAFAAAVASNPSQPSIPGPLQPHPPKHLGPPNCSVLVTGFVPSAASLVLRHFRELGQVTKHFAPDPVMYGGRGLVITYARAIQAKRALTRNRRYVPGLGAITVEPYDPNSPPPPVQNGFGSSSRDAKTAAYLAQIDADAAQVVDIATGRKSANSLPPVTAQFEDAQGSALSNGIHDLQQSRKDGRELRRRNIHGMLDGTGAPAAAVGAKPRNGYLQATIDFLSSWWRI
ncbi:hypothetical protein GQ42DRAFT_157242 [Ramicandelaber brevisporus]|nr:hypothetical protein GQ42DRAFT_157242 [Ramicandelaber brevisporus]